ncbi:MAG: GAF domain-containing protein, partial [Hyphomicrobiaceae bacterium]|nr:GAF domain-containing protein [Hyphomicrobiaceae bacterium]
MEHSNIKPRIMVLKGRGKGHEDVFARLSNAFEVVTVEDITQAVTMLRGQHFDGVFSETSDFLPIERETVRLQASALLDTLGEGVCAVDGGGRLLWANQRLRDWPEEVQDCVSNTCREAMEQFRKLVDRESRNDQVAPHLMARTMSLTTSDDRIFEVVATPLIAEDGHVAQVVGVVREETASRRIQQRIDAIDRAGRELVRIDRERIADLEAADRLAMLEERIIRITRETMRFDHFRIRLLNKETNELELVFAWGFGEKAEHVKIQADANGNGISGYVAATGRSYICHDTHRDPRYITGLASARSSLTVPLVMADQIIGTFNIESEKTHAFNEDSRQLLEILSRYIALALNTLDLLIYERYKTTGQTAEDVKQEIAGPLNDILTDATSLTEDALGLSPSQQRKLGEVIKNVRRIKESIAGYSGAKRPGIVGKAEQKEEDPYLAGKTILVADDEETIRTTVRDVLSGFGLTIETARTGDEA